ncbi:MAG: hypothetical protein EBS55_10125, partial [Flavobacteriaceae bacterium]|nr:hypothetical protein [Flavobacteriaceae bacterium]
LSDNGGKAIVSFVSPLKHGITVGEFVKLDFSYGTSTGPTDTFQVYSLGDGTFGSDLYIFNLLNPGFLGTTFSDGTIGTAKRVIIDTNLTETTSKYYVRRNKILTNPQNAIMAKAAFEQNIFKDNRKLERAPFTPNAIRRYLGQRFLPIPEKLIEELKGCVDVFDRNAYEKVKEIMRMKKDNKYKIEVYNPRMRRWELKEYKTRKFYKDIFGIIYTLGGIQPQFQGVNKVLQQFKDIQYQFFQDLNHRPNMPSHFMILDLLLKQNGHEPYYKIPSLKNEKARREAINILSYLQSNVRKAHGTIEELV